MSHEPPAGPARAWDGRLAERASGQNPDPGRFRSTEAFYHVLVDNLPHYVFRKDPHGRFTYANLLLCENLGRDLEDLLGKTDFDLFPADLAARYQAGDREVIRSGQKLEAVEEYRLPDGDRRFIQLTKVPLFDPYGRVVGVQGVFWDVTEQRRAEEAIREQADLLNLAGDAIIVRDPAGNTAFWNQGAERLYGWTAAEARGQPTAKLTHDEADKLMELELSLQTRGEWSGELKQKSRAGGELVVMSRWTLVRDPQGRPKSVLIINTDLTERKRLEAQFLRVQRMEGVGTLASGLAHDLNNILAPIVISVPLLRGKLTEGEIHEIVATIESSARRGTSIIRQLLTFGRGVEGERIPVQVRYLIEDTIKIARETFPRSIRLRALLPDDIWPVNGDPTQIHQVLLNLAVNARDAMPAGGELCIAARNLMLDEQYAAMNIKARPIPHILVRVQDTGTGIPREIRDKIFDPFFTTKEVGKGTGLGLSTVAGIVKSHGGFIELDSEPGRGTAFSIYLPALPDARQVEGITDPVPSPNGSGEAILVVDDEDSVRDATRKMLERHGYRVHAAGEGSQALALFSTKLGEINLVITDVDMPVMDGLALVRVLRKMAPRLQIIASTGLSTDQRIEALRQLGIERPLFKPYTADELLQAVHAALHRPGVARGASGG
ncbi:MAG: PAS/PAC sensor hybrid histidine kinase [Limisphaerales bacterium]|nr:MAG: PAS/PAC sensor hybrid histidine kinase [Limisphaerales bacterium]KAG0507672.1 MAG: PAS/PAC sensor hybrid histidine kinase [Limisphaerales bacterium]TXT51791.1 MAG: PAS/PAC sensor hybrid histidine kinase [Limisphaerales bacterium]